jgi:hypothetical protein
MNDRRTIINDRRARTRKLDDPDGQSVPDCFANAVFTTLGCQIFCHFYSPIVNLLRDFPDEKLSPTLYCNATRLFSP